MTVTYRKIAAEGRTNGSGGSGATGSHARTCAECGTRYAVVVRPATTIRFEVSGPTCDTCRRRGSGPATSPRPGNTEAPPESRLFKVWWAGENTGGPRLEARHVTPETSTSIIPDHRAADPAPVEVTDAATLTGVDWVSTMADVARTVLGELAWEVLASVWLGGYCEVLAALADVLDLIWSTHAAEADATDRVVVRLTGLPPVPAALIGDLATRSFLAHDRPPLPCAAEDLRAVGMLVCAGTGHAPDCPCAQERARRLVTGVDSYLFEESAAAVGGLRVEDGAALPSVPEAARPPVEEHPDLPRPPGVPGATVSVPFSSPLLGGRQALRDAQFGTPQGPQIFGRRQR
ncbi:hypothetical protein Val02_48260 [Virgisporangium aliadipatigenens]|uniref:Uncharacterized protein n=1 Tax=Virgisporangium aliadipatigenens TaxID=741659 RepID=A0A8J3YQ38_9ACTN|nr:hypothetical protein [Virgisporangium aliadipatigenens]GIJ47940.1 hypothetical protein Val02_48260 [Virgisporangium aliadipatigenens]